MEDFKKEIGELQGKKGRDNIRILEVEGGGRMGCMDGINLNDLCAGSPSVALALGGGSGDGALHVGPLGLGRSAGSVGERSPAAGHLEAGVGGLSALGVDGLELAVGVTARGSGKVSESGVALLSDFDAGVSAHGGDGDGGGGGSGRGDSSGGGSSSSSGSGNGSRGSPRVGARVGPRGGHRLAVGVGPRGRPRVGVGVGPGRSPRVGVGQRRIGSLSHGGRGRVGRGLGHGHGDGEGEDKEERKSHCGCGEN